MDKVSTAAINKKQPGRPKKQTLVSQRNGIIRHHKSSKYLAMLVCDDVKLIKQIFTCIKKYKASEMYINFTPIECNVLITNEYDKIITIISFDGNKMQTYSSSGDIWAIVTPDYVTCILTSDNIKTESIQIGILSRSKEVEIIQDSKVKKSTYIIKQQYKTMDQQYKKIILNKHEVFPNNTAILDWKTTHNDIKRIVSNSISIDEIKIYTDYGDSITLSTEMDVLINTTVYKNVDTKVRTRMTKDEIIGIFIVNTLKHVIINNKDLSLNIVFYMGKNTLFKTNCDSITIHNYITTDKTINTVIDSL